MARALLFLCAFLFAAPTQAARFSGDYLLEVCSANPDGTERIKGGYIACQAYIAGVLDYHNLIRSMGTAPSVDFCVPEDVSMKDIQAKVTQYLYENRASQGPFIASPAVSLGLFKAYPCAGKKAKPQEKPEAKPPVTNPSN